ncbi:MAG TPA: DEAD/DEAH box helicase [Candidatus Thermoplasmatota archaeon]|nr:DEAD/DEAH box helicase [Candidatus Thermoplasmatota archaeon]
MDAAPPGVVRHRLLRPDAVARRDYQVAIAAECLRRNTLVILPTGLGKTVVALLVIAERLDKSPGKVLFLAPTKPLAEQHAAFLASTLTPDVGRVELFTGEVPPAAREKSWRDAAIVVSTPEVVVNDLVSGRIHLHDVTLVVFDEAHRAVGDYAYVFIGEKYRRTHLDGLVLGMTASPGASPEKIREVSENLGIAGVEVRSESDADVRPHVQDVGVEWVHVAVPESLKRVAALLETVLEERVQALRATGAYKLPYVSKKELLQVNGRLQAAIREAGRDAPSHLYQALSAQAAALKVSHALELAETQGASAVTSYLERLRKDESKAAKALVTDARVLEAERLLGASQVEHPKLRKVALIAEEQVQRKADSRIIVFSNYRDTAEILARELAAVEGLRPARFVGQQTKGDDKGLSQAAQADVVRRFKEGEFNVLVATSVAEEGLDIPATDLVVFYEPVASEIRTIQRRGRTGRRRAGRVVILVTKDTKDETYLWASRGKEKKMRDLVATLKQWTATVNASESAADWRGMFVEASPTRPAGASISEMPLDRFLAASEPPPEPEPARLTIVVDHREFRSAVVRELARGDVVLRPDALEVADYVLSDRLAVERKEASDYVASLLDGRLFREVRALKDAYPAAIVVIEGPDLLTARRVEPAAVYASLASLVADFRVSVLQTKDASETADLLLALAKREQRDEHRTVALRGTKGVLSDEERLQYIVEGFPGVSAVLARRLLARFGSLRAIANANVDELREVEGVGPQIAGEIRRIAELTWRADVATATRKGSAPRGR